jgi:hypothetical protein
MRGGTPAPHPRSRPPTISSMHRQPVPGAPRRTGSGSERTYATGDDQRAYGADAPARNVPTPLEASEDYEAFSNFMEPGSWASTFSSKRSGAAVPLVSPKAFGL